MGAFPFLGILTDAGVPCARGCPVLRNKESTFSLSRPLARCLASAGPAADALGSKIVSEFERVNSELLRAAILDNRICFLYVSWQLSLGSGSHDERY